MLIKTEAENNQIQHASPGGVCCAYCGTEVYFPRVQGPDTNSSIYHPVCASQFAHMLLRDAEKLLFEAHAE